jgi:two-component system CitB family sensor kinase
MGNTGHAMLSAARRVRSRDVLAVEPSATGFGQHLGAPAAAAERTGTQADGHRWLPLPRLTLASQILLLQLGVIALMAAVGTGVSVWVARQEMQADAEHHALTVAETVAAMPSIRQGILSTDPTAALEPVAMAIQRATQANFVVILNREGVRLAHPQANLIGTRVTDLGPLNGKTWEGFDNDTLGPSVWAKAPIDAPNSTTEVGVASVGFREALVGAELSRVVPSIAMVLLSALILAVLGSLLLSRHLKRRTFGMNAQAIAGMFEQREAILHGIREGIIATDLRGRVTVINDEARDLLGLGPECIGRLVSNVLPPGRVQQMLTGGEASTDEVVLAGERVLVANRRPVVASRGVIGYVVTLRDRTELIGVQRELDSVRSFSDALRAQAHDFSNRLHTVAGLIEMGRHEDALRLIGEETSTQQDLLDTLMRRVGSPVLSALLLGKSVVAKERGVELRVADDTAVLRDLPDPRDIVTVVGNLIDNAIEAVAGQPDGQRWVEVSARIESGALLIRVSDSGPGVNPSLGEAVFEEGVSTKAAGGGALRGLGLSLVRQVLMRNGGSVSLHSGAGAVFTARLPIPDDAAAGLPAAGDVDHVPAEAADGRVLSSVP